MAVGLLTGTAGAWSGIDWPHWQRRTYYNVYQLATARNCWTTALRYWFGPNCAWCRISWLVCILASCRRKLGSVYLSMLTNSRAPHDAADICRRLRAAVDIPASLLISPTILTRRHLEEFRDAGADKIGVAIDLATPELFAHYRGAGVGGRILGIGTGNASKKVWMFLVRAWLVRTLWWAWAKQRKRCAALCSVCVIWAAIHICFHFSPKGGLHWQTVCPAH